RRAGLEAAPVVGVAPPPHLDDQGVDSRGLRVGDQLRDRRRRGDRAAHHPESPHFAPRLRRTGRRCAGGQAQQRREGAELQGPSFPEGGVAEAGPRRTVPGRRPVIKPFSNTGTPLTSTALTPSAYWCGFS